MKKQLSLALALVMMFSLLAGCGQPASSTPSTSKPAASSTPATPPAASSKPATPPAPPAEPARTDIRMANTSGGWTNPDPHFASRAPDTAITGAVYEGLNRVTANNNIEPLLADLPEITPDGLTYTYKLRSGVKFSNGDPVTAADVVFSFERAMTSSTKATHTKSIEKVEALDETTVRITLKSLNNQFDIFGSQVEIMNKKVVEAAGEKPDFSKIQAGSGAYVIDTWKGDEKVILKANPNYHGQKPQIETVEYIVFGDGTSALMAFEAGQIDYYTIPKADWERVTSTGKYNTAQEPSDRTVFILMNCSKEPFDDVRVRQAVNHAINRQEIIDAVTYGTSPEATHIGVPGKHRDVPATTEVTRYEYNVEKAKQLMKDAGYENGITLSQKANCSSSSANDVVIMTLMQEYLAEIGIKFEIAPQDNATNNTHYVAGNYLFGLWSNGSTRTAGNIVNGNYVEGGAYTTIHFRDEKVEELQAKGLKALTQAEREEIYLELYQQVTAQAYHAPLYYQVNSIAWAKGLNADPTQPIRTWSWN